VLLGAAACSDDGDSGEGDVGDGVSLTSYPDAEAIAQALGCADTFQAFDGEPMVGPVPESAGYCEGDGSPNIEVYAPDEVDEIIRDFPTVGCSILQTFGIDRIVTVAGEDWMVTPSGEPDTALAEQLASTLGGEVHDIDCA
jgi:hypothetical protein